MNLDTLEPRLSILIQGRGGHSHNQRHQQLVNSSSSIGTMIPTPGMSHSVNSSMIVASSVDTSVIASTGSNTIAPSNVNTGSLMSAGGLQNGSFNRSDGIYCSCNFLKCPDYFSFYADIIFAGTLSNGYQQSPANFSIGSQRITSQMIPTPGFNSNNNNSSSSSSNLPYMNVESSNNGGGPSTVESTTVPQLPQEQQHVGGQNSCIFHNTGSQRG